MGKGTLLLTFLCISALLRGQAIFQSQPATGSWSQASSWVITSGSDIDGVPDADDQVVIIRGSQITVTGTVSCLSVNMSAADGTNGLNAQLLVAAGSSLHVLTHLTLSQNGSSASGNPAEQLILDISGSLQIDGNVQLINSSSDASPGLSCNNTLSVLSGGLMDIGGELSLSNTSAGTGTNQLNNNGSITAGNFRASTGSGGSNNYSGDLTCADSAVFIATGAGNNIFSGDLTISAGVRITTAGGTNLLSGNISGNGFFEMLTTTSGQNIFNGSLSLASSSGFQMYASGGNAVTGKNTINGTVSIANLAGDALLYAGNDGIAGIANEIGDCNITLSGNFTMQTGNNTTCNGSNLITNSLQLTGNSFLMTAGSQGNNVINGTATLNLNGTATLSTTGNATGYNGDNLINNLDLSSSSAGLTMTCSSDGRNQVLSARLNLAGGLSQSNTTTINGIDGTNTLTIRQPSSLGGSLSQSTASLDGQNIIQVQSALASGAISMTSGSSTGTSGTDNQIIIGNGSLPGTLSCTGITMSSPNTGATVRNQLYLNSGLLDINGNLSMTGGSQTRNQILWDDTNPAGSGFEKAIQLAGSISSLTSGQLTRDDTGDNAAFTFTFDGSSVQQTLPASNYWQFKRINITNTYDTVLTGGVLSRAGNRLLGMLTLGPGVILKDNAYLLGGTGNDSLEMQEGSRYVIENLTSAFPAQVEFLALDPTSVIEFRNLATSTQLVLGGSLPKTLYQVELSGSGVKEVQAGLSATVISVENIWLKSGTLTFNALCTKFGLRDGTGTPTGTFTATGSATLKIPRNFAADPSARFSFSTTSTVEYSNAGNQKIYRMHAGGQGSGLNAALGNLTLSGSGIKDLSDNDSLKITRKLTIGTGTTLELSNGSRLTLISDASGTAWVGNITGAVSYVGTGSFVVQRYFSFPASPVRFRDYTSPVQGTTLKGWMNDGMLFTGFTGANYPPPIGSNTFYYNESTTGNLDKGFVSPANITDSIVSRTAGKVTRSGWRIYSSGSFTLSDTGKIFSGSVPFEIRYTNNSTVYNNGWNFIGNPFPSAIDWELVVADAANSGQFTGDYAALGYNSGTGIGYSFYQWMPTENNRGNESEAYSAYNPITHVAWYPSSGSGLTKEIPAHQGFWVKCRASSNTTYTLTIKESHKMEGAGSFHKSVAPELAYVRLSDGKRDEQVGLHFFQGATSGFDEVFDIEKFGSLPETTMQIGFQQADTSLPLWVNAIAPEQVRYSFVFSVVLPAAGEYQLKLVNLRAISAGYSCAQLRDLANGTVVDVLTDSVYSFSTEGFFSGKRFELVLSRDLNSAELQVSPASCRKKDDGWIKLHLSKYPGPVSFALRDDAGRLITRFEGEKNMYKYSLAAGNYVLTDEYSNSYCAGGIYPFTIGEPGELTADFDVEGKAIVAGQTVMFMNKSSGGTKYEWDFGDGTWPGSGNNPAHVYREPGVYEVELKSSGAGEDCNSRHKKVIQVFPGPADISSGGFNLSSLPDGLQFSIPVPFVAEVSIFAADGRLLTEFRTDQGQHFHNFNRTGNFIIVTVRYADKQYSRKLVH